MKNDHTLPPSSEVPPSEQAANSLIPKSPHETFGRELLRDLISDFPRSTVTHIADLPAREGTTADWPQWIPDALRAELIDRGIEAPWTHQAHAADLAYSGQHCIVATGTASGKSLAYLLPILATLGTDDTATALYLSPTKALGADQLSNVHDLAAALAGRGMNPIFVASFDGDTPQSARRVVREEARWVFSNPDMVHLSLLRQHDRWRHFLRNLRFLVVDECHSYRGIFGAQVSWILRRLLRLCRYYGGNPTVVFASATMADPADHAHRLIGHQTIAVTDDGAAIGARTIALWEPGLLPDVQGENGAPVRRPAPVEAAEVMAHLLADGARTLTFTRARRSAESVAIATRERLETMGKPSLANQVESYRGGYLAEERRDIERRLDTGELAGVATTNALELGIDIGGLDAVVQAGFPGTVASFWQQAGRAGRRGQGALVVLVGRDDPMDTYLIHHPSALLGKPVEKSVFDPINPHVMWPHLYCASVERPLDLAQLRQWPSGVATAEEMVAAGWLRRRRDRFFPTDHDGGPRMASIYGEIEVRGTAGGDIAIVDNADGRLLGTVDQKRAMQQLHDGAVYLHRGQSFVVDLLDLDSSVAFVHPEEPEYTTHSREQTDISVLEVEQTMQLGAGVSLAMLEVQVFDQVTSYLRRLPDGAILDSVDLDYPPTKLITKAVAYTLPDATLRAFGVEVADIPGALHAAEHAAIGLLPLVATCDRWDLGGVSTALHPDTGQATVFVYDAHPGGAGFARRGFDAFETWITATRDAVESCECETGCPSCIQSPKCGNGNEPLDKAGAIKVLSGLLETLRHRP